MYDLAGYASMIAFKGRTSAYARALEAHVVSGSVVLDIGAGSGILSFLACRAGAAKVYAVESDDIILLARETAADNGFADRIEFIQALTTEIELPEKVDGMVFDLHGTLPLNGKNIVAILDARDRFLKPGGWIVPARETMWAAIACCPSLHSSLVDTWDTEYRFDFGKARLKAVNHLRGVRLKPEDLTVAPQRWAALDYRELDHVSVKGDLSWTIEHDATAHGFGMWYEPETADGATYSISPASSEPYTFRHAFFPWPEAVDLRAGDRASVSVRADFVDPDYVWSWGTSVTSDSGQVKARYRQSTFIGALLSHERLRRRAAKFVPMPNQDSRIDYKIRGLMDRCISLGEIATALIAEFPGQFKDWHAALAKVGSMSEKYSK